MTERYRAALALLPERLPGLLRNRSIDPQWTGEGDRFWYRRDGAQGYEYVLVDPDGMGREPLFDTAGLAARLGRVFGVATDPRTVPVTGYDQGPDGTLVRLGDGRVALLTPDGDKVVPSNPGTLTGPDGRTELFRRDDDLWLREPTGAERRLTRSGEEHFAWGAGPDHTRGILPLAARDVPLPPMLASFSPSGRFVLTGRLDERGMTEHPFVDQLPPDRAKPRLRTFRYHHLDEPAEGTAELAIIDVATGRGVAVTDRDDLAGWLAGTGADTVAWSPDESQVHVVAHRPGSRTAALERIDVRTGERTELFRETTDPLHEVNTHVYSLPLIRVLPAAGQAVWFSQRDGWGHLYLYDLATGECLRRITSGDLVVRDILRVDEENREVLFVAGTGEDGGNPYWRRLYKASLDRDELTLLTPEPADHELRAPAPAFFAAVFGGSPVSSISPSGRYFVDHLSNVRQPAEILLRETATGAVVGELERTDASALLAAGYQVPQQFHVPTEDGRGELWGMLTLPADPVDPDHVPVIDLMYAGFQTVAQPTGFLTGGGNPAWTQLGAAYAALGFATVVLDGRGTPGRHREFRQWTRQRLDAPRGLDDHVAAIRALGEAHPELDLERVGVTGHSYGGYNSVRSILYFPDFFRVAVSSAGVHLGEKMPRGSWWWFLGEEPHDPADVRALGNLHLVDRLRGKLLLLCGDQDLNASMDHTFALVDALIKAHKRFDLKVWPGRDHYDAVTPYARAVMWDYFVEHLLGEAPPAELPL